MFGSLFEIEGTDWSFMTGRGRRIIIAIAAVVIAAVIIATVVIAAVNAVVDTLAPSPRREHRRGAGVTTGWALPRDCHGVGCP